ncbi:rhombosortase [Thiolapillus sp.]
MFTEHREKVRHGGYWLPWRTLLLSLAAIGVYWVLGAAPDAWVFDRLAISQGEWWRLITGHWAHSDADHALWDIGALMLLGSLFERRLGNHLLWILLAASLAVDAWIWWGQPSLAYYCGLSGILNALMAAGLLRLWREMRHPLILITGLGFVAKVAIELSGGQMLLTATAWPGVPGAHAVGLVSGMLYTLLILGKSLVGWSSWRRPGSMALPSMDSGLRRNDIDRFIQVKHKTSGGSV